jgi:hypothetical protein
MRRLIFAICVLLALPKLSFGDPLVKIKMWAPRGIVYAPAFVKAQVTVERDDANRELCFYGLDGEFKVLDRCYPLNGSKEPRTHWFEFKSVGPGRYMMFAVVRRSLDHQFSERIPVRILAPGESLGGPDDTQ